MQILIGLLLCDLRAVACVSLRDRVCARVRVRVRVDASPCVNCDVRVREPYVSMGASWE